MKIHWTNHAKERLAERALDKDAVEVAVQAKSRGLEALLPGQKCRVFGSWGKAALSRTEDGVVIVTVFQRDRAR